jgi:hypothetical protein
MKTAQRGAQYSVLRSVRRVVLLLTNEGEGEKRYVNVLVFCMWGMRNTCTIFVGNTE